MKKIFLALGALSAVAIPIATVVSCGSSIVNKQMSWTPKSKTVSFNLNQKGEALSPMGLNKSGLTSISTNFDKATTENNVQKLKKNDVITMNISGMYTYTAYHVNTAKKKWLIPAVTIVVNYIAVVKYKYNTENTLSGYQDSAIKTNILDSLVNGFKGYLWYTPTVAPKTPIKPTIGSLLDVYQNHGSFSQNAKTLYNDSVKVWTAKGAKHIGEFQTPRSVTLPTITV